MLFDNKCMATGTIMGNYSIEFPMLQSKNCLPTYFPPNFESQCKCIMVAYLLWYTIKFLKPFVQACCSIFSHVLCVVIGFLGTYFVLKYQGKVLKHNIAVDYIW